MSDRPYTVQELASRWQVSDEAIYDLIRRKDDPLPAFRVGGKLWRIRAEDVETWESAGGNTKSDATGSERSGTRSLGRTKPSSVGGMTTAKSTAEDLESSLRRRAESRLTASLVAAKP